MLTDAWSCEQCLAIQHRQSCTGAEILACVQVYGPESSGKTTLALHAMAEVQKNGGTAALIDAEHAFDPEYSKVGVHAVSGPTVPRFVSSAAPAVAALFGKS